MALPKVVWLRVGNQPTKPMADLLTRETPGQVDTASVRQVGFRNRVRRFDSYRGYYQIHCLIRANGEGRVETAIVEGLDTGDESVRR